MHIDWLNIQESNQGQFRPLNNGNVISIDEHGEVEWTTAKAIIERGSDDSSVRIKIDDHKAQISFNPSRWNRPDNLFGVNWNQSLEIANQIMTDHGQPKFTAKKTIHLQDNSKIYPGAQITRLDVCQNITTGSAGKAKALLRFLYQQKLPREKTSRFKTTVYFNRGSTHRTRKAYIKSDEIRARKKKLTPYREQVAAYCDQVGLVRLEVKYANAWLKRNKWRPIQNLNDQLIGAQFMKDTDPMKPILSDDEVEKLTPHELGVLSMWLAGHNPREQYSQSQFYRTRKIIKEKTGYDIADETIVPFRPAKKIIVLSEAIPPGWYVMPDGRTYAEHLAEA